ncbi:hypothetical protein EVAR_14348_1 [Eumeta japonica]|uniref:Uncharacterized protein n=1 Tax=Eumeta variegata TaxID=151549 RepID=A0A4C1TX26_EUMVA|nr:hypothetical protein EVAR_14348_1 [Eumeta japonica]
METYGRVMWAEPSRVRDPFEAENVNALVLNCASAAYECGVSYPAILSNKHSIYQKEMRRGRTDLISVELHEACCRKVCKS